MIIPKTTGYQPVQRQRKSLFPFSNGMRSTEFKGVGANRAENVWFNDGMLQKMDGTEEFKMLSSITDIVFLADYQKDDGTHQVLVAYPYSTYYLLRAIEEDGTIVTPTGGAGDVNFTSDSFSFTQLLSLGFVGNDSATTAFYSWNGTALTVVANSPTEIKGLARDGKRVAAISDKEVVFSGDGMTTDWNGTGVNIHGKYGVSLRSPKAVLTAGVGVIVIGETGSEAHKVVPNNASDDVSADTKVDSYNDREIGVTMQKQATMGKDFIWRISTEGILRTNPFNGQTVNITDVGKIRRYMKEWDLDDAAIAYDEKNEQVVCVVKEGGQNDTIVCIDASQEDLPVSIKPRQYYAVLASIDNQMYGGGSREGNIDKLFSGESNRTSDNITFRYITEWDELTNQMYWKNFKHLSIAAHLNPTSSMVVKIYFDGNTEAAYTETFTSSDTAGAAYPDAAYGMYLFSGGAADLEVQNSDQVGESETTRRFSTMCVEIYESSGDDFEIQDIIIEYKTKNKYFHSLSRKNVLFT